jgi:hypothetical protein
MQSACAVLGLLAVFMWRLLLPARPLPSALLLAVFIVLVALAFRSPSCVLLLSNSGAMNAFYSLNKLIDLDVSCTLR